ncbi:hypothetical protein ACI2I3_00610 [Psychrobacter namhaensis]|uniref:Uncharacterized protein n=1 Tax=Psychrobacter namhaensis TaxID=292734 RepID=A0ABW8L4J9_9GAMM
MRYATMDYERIANSKPINGTAANMMRKPETISEFEEIREEFKNTGLALKSSCDRLSKLCKKSDEYAIANAEHQRLSESRKQLKRDYPHVIANNRNKQGYIIDELKKRVTKEQFQACIRQAEKTMLHELRFGEQA